MSHRLSNWPAAALLGGIVWLASATPAFAQYMPFVGGVRPWGPAWSPYGYNTFSRTTAAYSFVNPYTGGVFNYQYDYNRVAYGPAGYALGYGGGYAAPSVGYLPWNSTAGGYGTYGASSNPVTQQQLRMLRASSYQNRPAYSSEPATLSPRWTTGPADKSNTTKSTNLNEALIQYSESEILSGRTLNALVLEVRRLEEKGFKAEAPLFPSEVLTKMAYQGSGARLMTAVRSGKPEFPRPLTSEPFTALRTELERHYVAAVAPFAQSKAIDEAAADRLAAAAVKAKADPALRQLSDGDATTTNQFLDGLVELSKQAKDPSLAGIYPKWGTGGATATELVRHLDRHKLLFAPAPVGSEEAYGALHRGLSGYYAALMRVKK